MRRSRCHHRAFARLDATRLEISSEGAQCGAPRVAVVYGSEGGTCEMIAKSYAKTFAPACASIEAPRATLANRMPDLKKVAASFDVLVICTSSYGSGDPPANFEKFLDQLRRAVADESTPLAGLQHAVLGEGDSVYTDTFQNNPRLTDKYMGECGSRRFVARHETDASGDEDVAVSRNLFRDAVAAQLKKGLPAPTAAAIAWAKPRATHGQPVDQIKDAGLENDAFDTASVLWAACCWRPSASAPTSTYGL